MEVVMDKQILWATGIFAASLITVVFLSFSLLEWRFENSRKEMYPIWIKHHPKYKDMTYKEFSVLQRHDTLPGATK